MFGNKGLRNFRQCDVKVVETKDFVYVSGNKGPAVLSVTPSEDNRNLHGHSAVLHCPRTEDERVNIESQYVNHSSRLEAVNSVASIAAALVCADCRFSTMTPLEVSKERADLARAETERLHEIALRTKVIQELIEIDPSYKDAL